LAHQPLQNERQLLHRIASGDQDAFSTVFDHYQGRLYTFSLAVTRSGEIAEELVQDVFLKVWLKRSDLPAIRSFGSYLFVIMRNEAYDWLSKQSRQKRLFAQMTETQRITQPDTPAFLVEKETADFLQRAVSLLPPQQQRVFRLMREQGFSREETARALQIDENTVKTHMSRALKLLRAMWIAQGGRTILLLLFFDNLF